MSKVIIPDNLKGKELYKFLMANKSALINQKKSMLKRADAVSYSTVIMNGHAGDATKAAGDFAADPTEDTGVIRVKVAANTALWLDSHMDVLLPDNAKKSMRERKGLIPHIHDHIWEVTAEVGDVVSIYYQDIPLRDLGLNKEGTAQVLVFETDIRKDYNERVYSKYKARKVKQHSIGLQYVTIELAINDPDYEKEIDFWNKYIDLIINKEVAEDKGYFWVVSEIKLMENSAVLFGSNILTGTLDESKSDESTSDQPSTDTDDKPHGKSEEQTVKGMDYDKLADIFSRN